MAGPKTVHVKAHTRSMPSTARGRAATKRLRERAYKRRKAHPARERAYQKKHYPDYGPVVSASDRREYIDSLRRTKAGYERDLKTPGLSPSNKHLLQGKVKEIDAKIKRAEGK